MAFISVTDAAGRVLFRRAATQSEINEAIQAAEVAEVEGQAAMDRIAATREQSAIPLPAEPRGVNDDS